MNEAKFFIERLPEKFLILIYILEFVAYFLGAALQTIYLRIQNHKRIQNTKCLKLKVLIIINKSIIQFYNL